MEITALKSFRYGGAAIAAGQTFTAKDKDARLLIAIRKARAAKPRAAKPAATAVKPEALQAAAAATYQRRDMKAEPTSNT